MSLKDLLGYSTPTLKITMMGPRGSGKTTILTSIFTNSVEDFAPTKLYLRGQRGTPGMKLLEGRKGELMDVFAKQGDLELVGSTDLKYIGVAATREKITYDFELGLKGKEPVVNIAIRDFPGEYLISKTDEVRGYIQESDIVLLAIDTAYMMEGDASLNEEMNKIQLVTKYFSENTDLVKNKLVLLVPLKCEKHFKDGNIDDVTTLVKNKYSQLIKFFTNNNIACVVTPIQTLGDVEFDRFEDNIREVGVSKVAKYKYYGDTPKYRPMFCVQPLYYLLSYVADYNEWMQNHPTGGWWEKMKKRLLSLLMSNEDFYSEVKGIRRFMLTDTNGYQIVAGNTIWSLKKD